ncbi:MAG: hypothetical protein AABO41_06955 [Acidobacteriota bacterium]
MLHIELDAAIVPNSGLGGLSLRERLIEIQYLFEGLGHTQEGAFELAAPFDLRYQLGKGEVVVAVDVRNGKVFLLSASLGYRGYLFEHIFVGMKVKDAMVLEPRLYYDEAEELILCRGVPGLSLDVAEIDPPPESVPAMTISAINVFAQETQMLAGQRGEW